MKKSILQNNEIKLYESHQKHTRVVRGNEEKIVVWRTRRNGDLQAMTSYSKVKLRERKRQRSVIG